MTEEQSKEVAQIVFHMFEDGHVRVSGPIDNYPLTMDVLGRGMTALATHWLKKRMEEHPIVIASPKIVQGGN